MATDGKIPAFKNTQEMLQYLQQNNILPQVPQNNNLDWSTTNQLVQPNLQGGAYNVPNSYPPYQSEGIPYETTNQLTTETTQPVGNGINQWNRMYLTGEEQTPTEVQQGLIEAGYPEESVMTTPTQQNTEGQPFQFYNPYGGFDLQTATFKLGESIGDKNTFGAVTSGLKVATNLARNFMSGLAYNKRNTQLMEEYKNNQRKALTQENNIQQYAEGGEMVEQPQNQEQELLQEVATALQQGEDPQTVLQTLLDMGVDEQTAQAMVQFVIEQLQGQPQEPTLEQEATPVMEDGGMYMKALVGKKIKDYTYNEKTGNYTVSYE